MLLHADERLMLLPHQLRIRWLEQLRVHWSKVFLNGPTTRLEYQWLKAYRGPGSAADVELFAARALDEVCETFFNKLSSRKDGAISDRMRISKVELEFWPRSNCTVVFMGKTTDHDVWGSVQLVGRANLGNTRMKVYHRFIGHSFWQHVVWSGDEGE